MPLDQKGFTTPGTTTAALCRGASWPNQREGSVTPSGYTALLLGRVSWFFFFSWFSSHRIMMMFGVQKQFASRPTEALTESST